MQLLIAARILSATDELGQNVAMRNSSRCIFVLLLSSNLLLASCMKPLPDWQAGKLVVIVPMSEQGAEAEFERELVRLFADSIHSRVEFLPKPSELIGLALHEHRAHFAAASLRSELPNADWQFGPSYQTVRELLVCNRDATLPKSITHTDGLRIVVLAASAQEKALLRELPNAPSLHWQTQRKTTTKTLFEAVSAGEQDCVVANELQFANARNFHGNLQAAFSLGEPSKLAWQLSKDADPALLKAMWLFFKKIQQDGSLKQLIDRFYGHSDRLKALDSATFIQRSATLLPRYRRLFEEAASVTGFDWQLLAALAYQESQWDPLATSFTNVRGMMMLTEATADLMKVKNRLNPRESIMAGAKYLAMIRDQLPARIAEPSRTWMALAAYNQGIGHLEDARVLTKRAGGNPDNWTDVKKWMPLISQPEYFETLKYGYARGGEAVILVESIRSYHDMLKRLEPTPADLASKPVSYSLLEPIKKLLRKRH